jgi:hypothetical protein
MTRLPDKQIEWWAAHGKDDIQAMARENQEWRAKYGSIDKPMLCEVVAKVPRIGMLIAEADMDIRTVRKINELVNAVNELRGAQ